MDELFSVNSSFEMFELAVVDFTEPFVGVLKLSDTDGCK